MKKSPIDRLIEALQIAKKYNPNGYVTHCEHDTLFIAISTDEISDDDWARMQDLGFVAENGIFVSRELGSC